ncbi:MAG TPA: RNA polymerase sigma factor RpoH [Candidatus Megaira endosymbiont of Nemacystus decipiens]|nr:RNA polymerase sigma factor RpoH [Candidatus Megaera endosymbiont of Nemacystus decipiens]
MSNLPIISVESGLGSYLKEVNRIPSLSQEEEFLYAKDYLEKHDLEAAHKLVKSHLKLVVKIAMNYKNYGLPVTDLVSEGNIGLMQAVKKFNPSLGFRLSTYSTWWIKAAIQEYILKSWSLVKIGTTAAQKKLFFSLNKIKNKLTTLYSRDITENDYPKIANALGVTTKEAMEMDRRLSGGDLSLNKSINKFEGSGHTEMIDLLPSTYLSQEDSLAQKQLYLSKKRTLSSAIATLTEREANILTARKLKDTPSTLDTLSNEYNISKERVRQIENKAFEKVKFYMLEKLTPDGQTKVLLNNG